MPRIKTLDNIVKDPERLLTVEKDITIPEAAKKMKENNIGCLVVVDSRGEFTGILSERDILNKVLAIEPSGELFVKDIMTTKAIVCDMDSSIEKVEELMAVNNIRHVPVVEKGRAVGMISSRDIVAFRLKSSSEMRMAAEEVAKLSARLKSLDREDIGDMIISDIPKSFGAEWITLTYEDRESSMPVVFRRGCNLSEKKMSKHEKVVNMSGDSWAIYGNICKDCEKSGGVGPRLVIPLNLCGTSSGCSDDENCRKGFICMCRFSPFVAISEEQQLYKASLLQEILNVNISNSELYQDYKKARRDSEVDVLTGVSTRRVLHKALEAEYARCQRYGGCFSLAIIDVDDLKVVNDAFGHVEGDKVLRQICQVMKDSKRTTDIITRYGGDEFVLLMPEINVAQAELFVNRLRSSVAETVKVQNNSVAFSCGLVEFAGKNCETSEEVLKRADKALYEAKRSGKNRIIVDRQQESLIELSA